MNSLKRILFSCVIALLPCDVAQSAEPPITSLVFTPDHNSVLAGSQAGVALYTWPELELKKRFELEMLNVHKLSFSPDGKHLAVAGGNPSETGYVEIFKWPTMNSLKRIGNHEDSVSDVCWLDPSVFMTASLDKSIKSWSLTGKSSSHDFLGHSKSVTAICLLKDAETMVSAGIDQSVRVWNAGTGELIRTLNQHTGRINALALRPPVGGLPMVATSASDRTIRFWQPTIGRMVRYIQLESEALSLVWLNDGERIAASCIDGHLRIVDAERVRIIGTYPAIDGWAYCLALHPSGQNVVVGGTDAEIRQLSLVPKSMSLEEVGEHINLN